MNLLDIFVSVDQPDLWAARAQMALSLACHIVIACFGVGLPLLVLVAEFRAQRGGGAVYDELAHRWAKVLASCSPFPTNGSCFGVITTGVRARGRHGGGVMTIATTRS